MPARQRVPGRRTVAPRARGEVLARAGRARRRRRRLRAAAAALGLGLLLPAPPATASPATPPALSASAAVPPRQLPPAPLTFRAPVDAAVNDGWRPPSTPYGPGNRGWQYATADADPVRAAGAGTVTFAGHVGGVQAVTITHRGGLRTSYTRLATRDVDLHDRVVVGEQIGTAMTDLHFGVRLGDRYIDPAVLFEAGALQYGARLRPL